MMYFSIGLVGAKFIEKYLEENFLSDWIKLWEKNSSFYTLTEKLEKKNRK